MLLFKEKFDKIYFKRNRYKKSLFWKWVTLCDLWGQKLFNERLTSSYVSLHTIRKFYPNMFVNKQARKN